MKGKIGYTPNFLANMAKGAGYDGKSEFYELIDNSIGANANEIKLSIKNGKFTIEDYGEDAGMDEATLIRNFFNGGRSSTNGNEHAPGKFGIGGKTGILAIVGSEKSTTVAITSHKKGRNPVIADWEINANSSESYEYTVLSDETIPLGTKIEFDFSRKFDATEFRELAGLVYCHEIENGLKLWVNDVLVQPIDPLYRKNETVKSKNLFKSKTFDVYGYPITVNSTTFFNDNIIPKEEIHSWDRGKGKNTKSVRTSKHSGIFIRTDGRYYTLGDNFNNVLSRTTHASYDGLRIEVVMPKALWDLIGITWNKDRKIKPFNEIDEFNNFGINDYIASIGNIFTCLQGETKDDKVANKLRNKINKIFEGDKIESINVEICASNNENNKFVSFKNNTLFFDVSSTQMIKLELQGFLKATAIAVDLMVKCGNSDMISKFLNEINN